MPLQVKPPPPPMEALSVEAIPEGEEWQYEPKWDGFRCLSFRDGGKVELQSNRNTPLARYFPELVRALADLDARRFVLDGEIANPEGNTFSFDALLQRFIRQRRAFSASRRKPPRSTSPSTFSPPMTADRCST